MLGGSGGGFRVAQQQAWSQLNQAGAVQNTWYTILDTTNNCRVIGITVRIDTTGETLEVQITADGETINGSVAANANTNYCVYLNNAANSAEELNLKNDSDPQYKAFLLEARSVKIEVRKTTANGAGNLRGTCLHATL